MAVTMSRERYRVDLMSLQAICDANYARLMRLLPEMRSGTDSCRLMLHYRGRDLGSLTLEVIENCPYTTVIRLRQKSSISWLTPLAWLDVRVYHDARMAEVIAAEHLRRPLANYAYPNKDMRQPDEKYQLNLFLGEWLHHGLTCGYIPEPVM